MHPRLGRAGAGHRAVGRKDGAAVDKRHLREIHETVAGSKPSVQVCG